MPLSTTLAASTVLGVVGPSLVVLVIVVVLVVVLVAALRRRRKDRPAVRSVFDANRRSDAGAPVRVPIEELSHDANRWLVRADDAVSASADELGFAVAEFGEERTQPFQRTLQAARREVAEAFTLKQRLDDAFPDTEREQREWNDRIISLCRRALDELASQKDSFDELRRLEKDSTTALAGATSRIEAVRERIPAATLLLDRLRSEYPPSASATVAANIGHAGDTLDAAERAAGTTGRGGVATTARFVEEAVHRAEQLLDAIEAKERDLLEARTTLIDVVLDSENDIREARTIDRSGLDPASVDAIRDAALQLERAIRDHATNGAHDPIDALDRLQDANQALERTMTEARSRTRRVESARSALRGALTSARGHVHAAGDFIATRRGGVGPEARTRLAEAERHLAMAEAEESGDPVAALDTARRAATLAQDAEALARYDVEGSGASAQQRGPGGPRRIGGGAGGGAAAGALIGGLLLGGLASRGWGGDDLDLGDLFD